MVNVRKELARLIELALEGRESRETISKRAAQLIEEIEEKELQIDPDLFSFLQYIEGFDMPDFEWEYLFTLDDSKIEYKKIKDLLQEQ